MAAFANGWGPIEKAEQLAVALEGEALQVLSAEEMLSYEDLVTALECQFGRVEPAFELSQRLATCYSKPGEKRRAGGRREVPGMEGVPRLPASSLRAPADPAAPNSPLPLPPDPTCPSSPPPSTPRNPRAEGSSPDSPVSLSPAAESSPFLTQGLHPQRQHHLPGSDPGTVPCLLDFYVVPFV
ncbi:UNVERIFIED_CONTAM: hypothetical protein FKN15_008370 [Acipenser sinensis]